MTKTPRWATRGMGVLTCVVVAPLVLAACSSTPAAKTTTTTTTSVATKTTTTPTNPFAVKNNVSARKDATLTSCQYVSGSWIARGTVDNSTASKATFKLEVAYTNAHATVLGVETTSVTPNSKQSASWSTSWPTSTSTGVICVLDAVSLS